jgi:transposase
MIDDYLSKVKNSNRLKLKKHEYYEIDKLINKIELDKFISKSDEIIYMDKSLVEDLNNFFKVEKSNNDLKTFLLNENKNENKNNFTVRKLANKYQELTGNKVSKSTVHNCLKKELGFKYLKTTIKTDKVLEGKNILLTFGFIKIISRCIAQKFNLIYVDETAIQNTNNNYYCWRKSNEEIFNELGPKKRLNLIMGVDKESVIYYEFNYETTNEEIFYKFMQKLIKSISNKNLYPCVIIMDNYSCHKTRKLIQLYNESNINILFNIPYLSSFNAIELCFRNIKRYLYTKSFASIEIIKIEIEKYMEGKEFKDGIKSNFKETLKKYIIFHKNNEHININNIV